MHLCILKIKNVCKLGDSATSCCFVELDLALNNLYVCHIAFVYNGSKNLFCDVSLWTVPSVRVHRLCPDCPNILGADNDDIQKAVSLSLAKFNKEGGMSKRFALLKVTRASAGVCFHTGKKKKKSVFL